MAWHPHLDVVVLLEVDCDTSHGLGDIALVSLDVDFRRLGSLVRSRDTGKVCQQRFMLTTVPCITMWDTGHTLDLTRPSLLV